MGSKVVTACSTVTLIVFSNTTATLRGKTVQTGIMVRLHSKGLNLLGDEEHSGKSYISFV